MSFFEDFISETASQGIYSLFKWIGIITKWTFHFGKKSILIIENEKWNRTIGFLIVVFLIAILVYVNK